MAELSKQALKVDNNQSFPNNNNGAITPSILRAFNTNMIDSTVNQDVYNTDSASWTNSIDSISAQTASYAISASVAAVDATQQSQINQLIAFTGSVSSVATGSLLVTASALSNVITFTKGDNSTFDVTVADTTNLTPLNDFTASQLSKDATLATYTGSVNNSLSNLNTFTQSANTQLTNLASSQSIDNTKWNTLGTQSGSWVTESESGSFLITASVNLNTITFTKGNNTTFAITVNTGSGGGGTADLTSLNAFTASQLTINAGYNTYTSSTNSRLTNIESTTASLNSSITQLNASSASQQVSINALNVFTASQSTASIVSSITNLNQFTSSANGRLTNLESTTASLLVETQNLELFSASALVSISNLNANTASQQSQINSLINATASYANSASVALVDANQQSQINALIAVTASFLTSSADITQLNAFTASQLTINSGYNTFTQSQQTYNTNNDTKWNTLGGQSGSWITESETGSFARYDVSNPWSANQTFTNITAVSASFQYVQTIFETASVIYSSGSNQFGDELSDIQTLSGSVKVQGSLTVNGTPVLTASVDISGLVTTASFNAYTSSNDAKVNSLINATASYADSASVALVDANQQSQINALIAVTASFLTASADISQLNAFTASQYVSNSFFATTGSNTFTGDNYFSQSVKILGSLSMPIGTISMGFPKNMGDPYDYNAGIFTPFINAPSGGGRRLVLQGDVMSSAANKGVTILNGLGITGSVVISPLPGMTPTGGDLDVYGTFTSSLQEGYVWVGNSSGKTTAISTGSLVTNVNTGSLATTASFNAYTQSNDAKVNSLISATGSFATTGSNTFVGDQTLQNSLYIQEPGNPLIYTQFLQDPLTNKLQVSQVGASGIQLNGIDLNVGGTFTSSLQEGYVWAGGVGNVSKLVATSSFGTTINTGSFATTGSNTFVALQSINFSGTATTLATQIVGNSTQVETDMYVDGGNYDTFNVFVSASNGIQLRDYSNTLNSVKTFISVGTDAGELTLHRNTNISGNLDIQSTLTASLEQGYVWVGNASGKTVTVATSSFGGGTIDTGSYITTGSATTASQTIFGDFKFDTTYTGNSPITAQGSGGSNILEVDYSVFTDGSLMLYWGNLNWVGITINGPGVTNATVSSFNFGSNYEITLSSGTVTAGQTYTFTGPAIQTIDLTGSLQVTSEMRAIGTDGRKAIVDYNGFYSLGTSGFFPGIQAGVSVDGGVYVTNINQNYDNIKLAITSSQVQNSGGPTSIDKPQIAVSQNNQGNFTQISFEGNNNYTNGTITVHQPLLVSSSLNVKGSSVFTGSLIQSSSNSLPGDPLGQGVGTHIKNRVLISANQGEAPPRLFISGSDGAYSEYGRGFQTLDTSKVPNLGAFIYTASPTTAKTYNTVASITPDYSVDVEMTMFASTGSVGLADWDNVTAFDYIPFMELAPNNGDNPAPVFTRGLTIQSGSAFTANGNKQFNVGAFTSNITQSGSANVSQSVNFEITDISDGVSIVSNSRITFANSGTYNIQFSAQIDRVTGSGTDEVYFWLKKNGTNVANTAGVETISGGALEAKTLAAWNYIVDAAANDYYELAWQTTDTNIHLTAITASGNIPAIPSIILTATQVR